MTMERVMEELEQRCHDNMSHAMETEEGLGIEYDEDVVCDVCQSPDGEDNNEMVFCDKCNICVHQVRGQLTHLASDQARSQYIADSTLDILSDSVPVFPARPATESRKCRRAAGCAAFAP